MLHFKPSLSAQNEWLPGFLRGNMDELLMLIIQSQAVPPIKDLG
jgi:hypothetical protein